MRPPHRPGVVGCGVYDLACADAFGMAFAVARGTPSAPLRESEDLFPARAVGVSRPAAELGVPVGMTGLEAIGKMLAGGASG